MYRAKCAKNEGIDVLTTPIYTHSLSLSFFLSFLFSIFQQYFENFSAHHHFSMKLMLITAWSCTTTQHLHSFELTSNMYVICLHVFIVGQCMSFLWVSMNHYHTHCVVTVIICNYMCLHTPDNCLPHTASATFQKYSTA